MAHWYLLHGGTVGTNTMVSPRDRVDERYNPYAYGYRTYSLRQHGWNGARDSSTPYTVVKESTNGWMGGFPFDAGNAPGSFQAPSSILQSCYNKAYARFIKRAKDGDAQLGATLGEYHQSSQMIRTRAKNLLDFTKFLFGRYKRLKRRGRGRGLPRTFADFWLEYSFGWAPLFGDLYDATQVMEKPIRPHKAKGKAKTQYYGDNGSSFLVSYTYILQITCFATVEVTNPNLALANRLGLVNPAAVAWELMKWSFVLDWLFDVGQWINSWTDRFGFDYSNSGVSYVQIGGLTGHLTWLGETVTSNSLVAQRINGVPLPLPNLDVLGNIGKNLKRAANAIALTTQLLTSSSPSRRRGH